MKNMLFSLILSGALLVSSVVFAKDLTVKCDLDTLAIGYIVEESDDLGITWVEVSNTSSNIAVIVNVPEDKHIMFRFANYNSVGKTYRYDAGVWYNGTFTVPLIPSNTGME